MKFLIFLLPGLLAAWASAFTAYYSRRWGERGGRLATFVLRNVIGIPLSYLGFFLAWFAPSAFLFNPSGWSRALGWFLILLGAVPIIWGHWLLGLKTHMPSVKDDLVREGLYEYVRHPIYSGGFLALLGLAFLRPTFALVLACVLGILWCAVQAFIEEIDLAQRMPGYRRYMDEVPRFIPRARRRRPQA
ncbi:MAG: hypothetical protein HY891_01875 [Deltaproteobacteria bacterium]|nr:hypothetical protein [Deltaproteobacteria bacterium]